MYLVGLVHPWTPSHISYFNQQAKNIILLEGTWRSQRTRFCYKMISTRLVYFNWHEGLVCWRGIAVRWDNWSHDSHLDVHKEITNQTIAFYLCGVLKLPSRILYFTYVDSYLIDPRHSICTSPKDKLATLNLTLIGAMHTIRFIYEKWN